MGDTIIWGENAVKLLDLIIDSGLTFNEHVEGSCKKESQEANHYSNNGEFTFTTRQVYIGPWE